MIDTSPFPPTLLVLGAAVFLDLVLGDPREGSRWLILHPVVWMGRLISAWDRRIPRGRPRTERVLGAVAALTTILLFSVPTLLLPALRTLHEAVPAVLATFLLKATFTARGLSRYAEETLEVGLEEQRHRVARIVSRETTDLSSGELHSATIESVAENLTDSVVSPLLFYGLFGLTGAVVYRVVNTLDAMVGYRTDRHRNVGWLAARLDSALNFLPERLSAAIIRLVGWRARRGFNEAAERPAATIQAMADVLGVRLEKRKHYRINPHRTFPNADDVRRAVRTMWRATAPFLAALGAVVWILHEAGWRWGELGVTFP